MSCGFTHDDGVYVLGALASTDRLAFEKHLHDCEPCTLAVRELAGLPGLLGRVDATALAEPPTVEPVADAVLPRLTQEVRRRRRRRTVTTLGAAAAAAAVAAVLGFTAAELGSGDGAPSTSEEAGPAAPAGTPEGTARMQPVGDVPVDARLTMAAADWGTRLELTCTYDTTKVDYQLPPAVDYVLVVRKRDGRQEDVGSWRSIDGRTMRLTTGTAADRVQIASVEVRTPDGRVVLTAPS